MKLTITETVTMTGGFIFAAAVIVLFATLPYFEAKTFNKFRKPGTPQATYWDALVSELRVDTE